ncbi:putative uncharacterized protein C7orf78 homolog [Cebidichthys violaceus]|uniref:putative uncharacterized protein C7orf78 homolog n=1 Tax=Cebidichthys violaceus TaxID=271503 RepID=UPI0035CA9B2F
MVPDSLFRPLSRVCFEDKSKFSASQRLSVARSKWFTLPETESAQSDAWSIKPPDFSLRLYRSLSDPRRTERRTHSNLDEPRLKRTGIVLPNVVHQSHRREESSPKFITSYRPPGALESQLMFVKTGKYLCGPYKNPKPHDFRPLDEDLPDMVTTYQRDPANLDLTLKHLDKIRTPRSRSRSRNSSLRATKTRMDTCRPAEPRWDAELVLPQLLWPPKSASYTRHGRRRGAYSAFLDRVEEKLSRSWKNRDFLF